MRRGDYVSIILLKFGVLNIEEQKNYLLEEESWGNKTDQKRSEKAAGT